jgi:hypothetical protein
MIRARIFATSCGYEDADHLDFLRTDPASKLACGKLPNTVRTCVLSRRCHGWSAIRAHMGARWPMDGFL